MLFPAFVFSWFCRTFFGLLGIINIYFKNHGKCKGEICFSEKTVQGPGVFVFLLRIGTQIARLTS